MAALAVKLNWTNVQLHGFWFVTNFLREEGLDDFAVKTVVDDLTEQYDAYRNKQAGAKHFGPDFTFANTEKPYIGLVQMFEPQSKKMIGQTHVCIDESGGASILPF